MAEIPQDAPLAAPSPQALGDEATSSPSTPSILETCDEPTLPRHESLLIIPPLREPPASRFELVTPNDPEYYPKYQPDTSASRDEFVKKYGRIETDYGAAADLLREWNDTTPQNPKAGTESMSCPPMSKLEPGAPLITQAHRDAARVMATVAAVGDAGAMQRQVQAQQPARAAL